MPAFEYRQAEEVRDALARHGVRYLFIGKSGAILLGFPDTTQEAVLFLEKSPANGAALVPALRELGFTLKRFPRPADFTRSIRQQERNRLPAVPAIDGKIRAVDGHYFAVPRLFAHIHQASIGKVH
jgi:hypothetical protein